MTIIDKPFTGTTTNSVASSFVTPEELAAFVAALNAKVSAAHREAYPTCEHNWGTIEHNGGVKFAKIQAVGFNRNSISAYCFIDLSNGNILKAAGWKAPAKGARGNIRVGDASTWWNGALNKHGAAYLR